MATEEQLNNPLHGVGLKQILTELIDFYGFEILAEYTRIKVFDKNPSLESSIKFFKKTEWAREKLEIFYLYKYKNLPKPDDANYVLPPRQRVIPEGLEQRPPVELIAGEAPPAVDKGRPRTNKPKSAGSYTNKKDTSRDFFERRQKRKSNRPVSNNTEQSANEPWDPWGLNKKD
ncbi:VF530 family DNA-binding protein [Catenovulum sp. SM1970]|uniref:VF530 family protein n=1 Tax=Marinifaba aquimaris TaxID=2741323 RepID=UPI00157499FA|nr:VF530 family DNA-binding protein [Marinifaba aquimaris]NTS77199.1 VF530 family DNA-binding protein [Marinifaba aquimaris]